MQTAQSFETDFFLQDLTGSQQDKKFFFSTIPATFAGN